MELYKEKNIEKSIRLRQEGKDCLSWIENFGLHLFDEKCMPRVSFNDGEKNEILVLRINKVQNIIYAYYCFFQTDSKGFSRFCVNKAESVDAAGLKDLMDRAKWEEDSTKNYWKEIFCGGKAHNVDETTLKRQETKTSPYYEMNMMEYIECIQKEIQKLLEKLCIPANENISKVLITEQYALAFPLKYALGRIFPNAKRTVYGCIQKIEEKSWKQNAAHFHISGKLLHLGLNTTPQMTISNVLSLREKGVTFTLPLSKGENGEYCLPTTSVIDNSELKWNDLMKGDIEPDYTVGNLAFKRVQLSMFADGFQNVFVNSGESLVCLSSNNNGIVVSTMPVPTNDPKVVTTDGTDSATDIIRTGTSPTTISPYGVDEDIEQKMLNIKHIIDDALEFTTRFLEKVAKDFFREKYPNEIWTQKYGESLRPGYMTEKWQENSQIEFSNFAYFLSHYRNDIIGNKNNPGVEWRTKYSSVVHIVDKLKPIRNTKSHGYSYIVGIGLRNLNSCLIDMEDIADALGNRQLREKMRSYYNELQNNFDKSLQNYWESDKELQRIYKEFETKKNK